MGVRLTETAALQAWEVRTLPLSSLKAAPYNPREISAKALKGLGASLDKFGLVQPVVWNKRSGLVVGGHQRLKVLELRGVVECPVVVVDLDDTDERALNVALNHRGIEGDFTSDLGPLLAELEADAPELFSDLQLDDLLKEFPPPEEELDGDLDELPEEVETRTKSGDLWALGEHRLVCGDSRDAGNLSLALDGKMADLVVTSPPYNANIKYSRYDDSQDEDDYLALIAGVSESVFSVMADGRFVAWNVGTGTGARHFRHPVIMESAGFSYYREIVWEKCGVAFPIWQFTKRARAARKFHPNYTHEIIYLMAKGEPDTGGPCEVDDDFSCDVWRIHASAATRDIPGKTDGRRPRTSAHGGAKAAAHPAAYPARVPDGLICHLSAPGERVLDPFAGAGTTLIAADARGRIGALVEMDPIYCDLTLTRWEDATGGTAELLVEGADA